MRLVEAAAAVAAVCLGGCPEPVHCSEEAASSDYFEQDCPLEMKLHVSLEYRHDTLARGPIGLCNERNVV